MGKVWTKEAEREQLRTDDACDNMPELLENRDEEIRQLRQKIVNSDAKHGETILRLEHERDCLADQLKQKDAEIQKLDHMLHARETECAKLEDDRDCLAECVEGHNENAEKQEKILRQMLNKAFAYEEYDIGDDRYGYSRAVREIAKAFGVKDEEITAIEKSMRSLAEVDEELVGKIAWMKVKGVND